MKKKEKKTNAMRFLENHHIPYDVLTYEWEDGRHTGLHAAEELHLNPDTVFKTLVVKGDKTGHIVFCIPVAEELDLKKAARVSGNKKVEMVPVKDILGLTGYMRGGCSPIGMKKLFPTYFHESMLNFERIGISAGQRGMQMRVPPKAVANAINATFVAVIHE